MVLSHSLPVWYPLLFLQPPIIEVLSAYYIKGNPMFRVLACKLGFGTQPNRKTSKAPKRFPSSCVWPMLGFLAGSCKRGHRFRLCGVHERMLEVTGFFVVNPLEPTEPWPRLNEVKLDLSTLVSALVVAANAHAFARRLCT